MKETLRSGMRARKVLADAELPFTDSLDLRESSGLFREGGAYGVEIPAINSVGALQSTIRFLKEEGVYCTRFNETHGSFLLSDGEVTEMLAICAENEYGLVIGLGPRPEYDVKASFYRTRYGLEVGRRVNNNDAIAASVEEALRVVELGCRGLTIYDIGVLRVLSVLRKKGQIPREVKFKTSSHCAVTNPMIAQIAHDNGADSVTTMHDLGLPVLQEMRRMSPGLCLDVPTDAYVNKGGFIRFYELAEMVQIASPMFLKMGASVQGDPYDTNGEQLSLRRVRRVKAGLERLEKDLPGRARISPDSPLRCLPHRRAPR